MNDAQVTNGSPDRASVQAYEEDWYRSLRALAERRRSELDQFDDTGHEVTREARSDAASPATSPGEADVGPVQTVSDEPDVAAATNAEPERSRPRPADDGTPAPDTSVADDRPPVGAPVGDVWSTSGNEPANEPTSEPQPTVEEGHVRAAEVLLERIPAPEDVRAAGSMAEATAEPEAEPDAEPEPEHQPIGASTLIDAMTLPQMRRLGAVRLFSENRSQALREALAGRAGDPLDETRASGAAAAEALARAAEPPQPEPGVEPEETVDVSGLARGVLDDEPDDVEAALAELSKIARDERVRDAAAERLTGVSSTDRDLAWSALRQCRPEDRHALFEAFMNNDRGLIVDIAFEHLHSVDEDERALAMEAVGWGATQACVEFAIRALGDPAAVVRRVAVGVLGLLRDRSAVAALGKALGDPDPEVRSGAVRALGVIEDEGVLSYLVEALRDPEQSVREIASHVLTEWNPPAVAKRLAGVLTVPSLRDPATDLLMRLGPTSVELLIDVLRQGTPELRGTVGPLLYSLIGVEEFVQRMDSLEPERRLRAAEALGAIGGPDAVDALTAALSDPDEHVRLRAAQLLGDLGDPRTADAVARLLDDPVPDVVTAAREALETRLDRRAADGYGYDHA